MRARGAGAIVQMSSMGGQLSPPGFGAYCAAKFALEAVSEALAAEVAPFGIRVLIVEPGSFRTGFAGGRLHRSPSLPAYADTVGPNRAFLDDQDGSQEGDPRKAAEAIAAALEADAPPLRLALGGDAVDAIRGSLESRLGDLARWEERSRADRVRLAGLDARVDRQRAARAGDRHAVVAVAERVAVADRHDGDRRQDLAALLGEPDTLPARARRRSGRKRSSKVARGSARACRRSRRAGSRACRRGRGRGGRRARRRRRRAGARRTRRGGGSG